MTPAKKCQGEKNKTLYSPAGFELNRKQVNCMWNRKLEKGSVHEAIYTLFSRDQDHEIMPGMVAYSFSPSTVEVKTGAEAKVERYP